MSPDEIREIFGIFVVNIQDVIAGIHQQVGELEESMGENPTWKATMDTIADTLTYIQFAAERTRDAIK